MKASGITAIGLVAAAGLWIASGHLLPRDSGEGHAAIRVPEAVKKAFRVAVVETRLVPHSRKLAISGRTEAERHGTITARTGGIATELKIRRGTKVKEGEVLAVLSDDARAAQVAQGKSLVFQRRTELELKRKLIETGRFQGSTSSTWKRPSRRRRRRSRAPRPSATAASSLRRGPGSSTTSWVRVGDAAFSFQGRELARSCSARSDAGGG